MILAGLNHAISLPNLIQNKKIGRLIKQDAPYSFKTAHLRRHTAVLIILSKATNYLGSSNAYPPRLATS
jgi:hypothetical protein